MLCLRPVVAGCGLAVIACGGSDQGGGNPTGALTAVQTTQDTAGDSASDSGGTATTTGTTATTTATTDTTVTTTATDGGSEASGTTIGSASVTAGDSSSGGVDVCADVGGATLMPPDSCDGPSGNTSTQVPSNNLFSTSWFGCYEQDDGSIYQDPYDNCEFACGSQGLCDAGQSGPECEAGLKWFAADARPSAAAGASRDQLRQRQPKSVLVTLDRGPNCGVEMDCETPVLDMGHDAMVYLFDGNEYGGCEHQAVVVEAVPDDTPLGPV
ncbi:MAG: hypothetical protein IPN32_33415 [Deltaproteobacteria bacterium]|nr:hypothetical protein [Deltaproteobacteria bacterium]